MDNEERDLWTQPAHSGHTWTITAMTETRVESEQRPRESIFLDVTVRCTTCGQEEELETSMGGPGGSSMHCGMPPTKEEEDDNAESVAIAHRLADAMDKTRRFDKR